MDAAKELWKLIHELTELSEAKERALKEQIERVE